MATKMSGQLPLAQRSAGPSRLTATAKRRRLARSYPRAWFAAAAVALVLLVGLVLAWPSLRPTPPGALSVLGTADFHALAFSPQNPDVVFFGHHNGIMRSDDGGRTWQPLVEQRNFDAMGLAVAHANPRRVYLAGHDVFQVSDDGGRIWQPVATSLPGTDIHGFALSPDDPGHLFAFVVGHGVFESLDAGRAWQRLGGQLPGDVTALAAAGGDPETLYVGSGRSGVLSSDDGGRTWARTSELSGTVLALAVDPSAPRTIYAGINGGLAKSTDGGASWTPLPFPGENAVAVAVGPSRPEVILAIAVSNRQGLVYRSEDGGRTWGGSQ